MFLFKIINGAKVNNIFNIFIEKQKNTNNICFLNEKLYICSEKLIV